jgi:hypothetical protein
MSAISIIYFTNGQDRRRVDSEAVPTGDMTKPNEDEISEVDLYRRTRHRSPGETFLDDSKYTPVLKKLNDLRVPIFLHPGPPLPQVQQPYYGGLKPEVSDQFSLAGWGWHNEAGIHVLRMILAGVFERFPQLQVISGHRGEMVPFYLQRLDDTMPPKVTGLTATIYETARRATRTLGHGHSRPAGFELLSCCTAESLTTSRLCCAASVTRRIARSRATSGARDRRQGAGARPHRTAICRIHGVRRACACGQRQ